VKDPVFLAWVRTRPCVAAYLGRCRGAIQAHHAGARGLGQKCRDDESIPLCDGHHDLFHDGPVSDWPACWATREERRDWIRMTISLTQAAFAARRVDLVVEF
jgi:hypothetical protein